MIIVSFLLVLIGLVTLLLGILGVGGEPMQFIYVSIAASLIAAVLLIIGIFRAKPAPPGTAPAAAGPTTWSGSVQGVGGIVPPDRKPDPTTDDQPTTQLPDLEGHKADGEDITTVFPPANTDDAADEDAPAAEDEPANADVTVWAPRPDDESPGDEDETSDDGLPDTDEGTDDAAGDDSDDGDDDLEAAETDVSASEAEDPPAGDLDVDDELAVDVDEDDDEPVEDVAEGDDLEER